MYLFIWRFAVNSTQYVLKLVVLNSSSSLSSVLTRIILSFPNCTLVSSFILSVNEVYSQKSLKVSQQMECHVHLYKAESKCFFSSERNLCQLPWEQQTNSKQFLQLLNVGIMQNTDIWPTMFMVCKCREVLVASAVWRGVVQGAWCTIGMKGIILLSANNIAHK